MDNNPYQAPVVQPQSVTPAPAPLPTYIAAPEVLAPPPEPPVPTFGAAPGNPEVLPIVPPPAPASPSLATAASPYDMPAATESLVPQPVIQVLSPRGVEYVFLTIALLTGAVGLSSLLIALVNGMTDFGVLSFPVAVMLVAVPVFARLFLRLKKAELSDPSIRLDASKRRSTQFIQIITFLVSFFTLIGFIAAIFSAMAGQYSGSIFKLILDIVVILGVAGGILFYYWRDEHR